MTQRIILFNGPPSCGKDTAAKAIWQARLVPNQSVSQYAWAFDRMSMPIKRAFAGMVGLDIDIYSGVEHWEARKEQIIPGFGVSYRQWQIDFSEKFMKPLYGEDIFGKLFVSRVTRLPSDFVIVVPDCGFDIEYKTLTAAFRPENVLVVKIWRSGSTFDGDSRRYLSVGTSFYGHEGYDPATKNVLHLSNNGTRAEFEAKVLSRVAEWLERTSNVS